METTKNTHKLPHLQMRPCPPSDRIHLSGWFQQRDRELHLRKTIPGYAEVNVPMPLEQREYEAAIMADLHDKPLEITEVKVGQIRELVPRRVAGPMVFVAILSEWPSNPDKPEAYSKEKRFLVAPFVHYHYPATTTEWLTGIEDPLLRVLCLWNTRDCKAGFLEESWVKGQLNTEQLADAWEVFRHALTGVPICDRVRGRVGAPIFHPQDPRLEYQKEETARFTVICQGS